MADTAAAPASAPVRPAKPDEALFKEKLAQAEKEHSQVMAKLNAIKKQIELADPRKKSDNPAAQRQRELQDELKEIRSKQGVGKDSRAAKQKEIDRLTAMIKERDRDHRWMEQRLRDAVEEFNLGDYDKKRPLKERLNEALSALEARYKTQTLRLAEEKEIVSKMERLGKIEEQLRAEQTATDSFWAKINEIRDSLNDPEAKALSEKYTELQTELDAINAEQNEARKNLNSLRDERRELLTQQEEKWQAKQKVKDEFHQQRKAFEKHEKEQKQKAWERSRAERERIDKERKLARAQKMLAEASDPAYLDEIRRANSLLQYYDPSFVAEKASLQPSTNLQAQAERKVDSSDLKGVKVLSKKDRDEELFPAAQKKKGKKGKKTNAAAAKSTFNCPPSVLEDCSYLDIDPPMSAEDVPAVIEKVKAKLDHWKADQAAQTQKNIEKAKKEIEKIEAEEAKENGGKKSSSGTATPNGNGAVSNGDKAENAVSEEKSDEKIEDVTKEVEKASLEEKGEEAVAAA